MISHGYAQTGWREHPRYRWLLSRAAAFPVAPVLNVTFRDLEGETFDELFGGSSGYESGEALIRVTGTTKRRTPFTQVPNAFSRAGVMFPYRSGEEIVGMAAGVGSLIAELASFDQLPSGPEAVAYFLHRNGAAGVAASHDRWTKGLVALFHRFDIPCSAT